MTEKTNFIESFARQLSQQVSEAVSLVIPNLMNLENTATTTINPDDLSAKLKPIIAPILEKFSLVPKAEFEAQARLLHSLDEQIQMLEARLQALDDTRQESSSN